MFVVITGPIASGKSTVARALALELASGGVRSAVIDLDDVHAHLVAHGSASDDSAWTLARGEAATMANAFDEEGVAVVIAEGSFNLPADRATFVGHLRSGSDLVFVTLQVSFDEALRRARDDPTPGRSQDPAFLASHFAARRDVLADGPATDIVIDTERTTPEVAATTIARLVGQPAGEADAQRRLLRATFEQRADLYDRARPTYPPRLFDDLAQLANLPGTARILEIGCGTGQATVPLAERGYRVTCVELGGELAAIARRNLSRFPQVEVVNADFESWQPAHGDFDAVVAFTSFHWIAPDVRYAKAASLLRDHGMLAIVTTEHVLGPDGDDFFGEVQEDYEAVVPDDPATKVGGPKPPDAIPDLSAEIARGGQFRNVGARRYVWDVVYTAEAYIAVLSTYSVNLALDDDTRARLLGRIRRRVEARPGAQVRKTYLAMLNVAERL